MTAVFGKNCLTHDDPIINIVRYKNRNKYTVQFIFVKRICTCLHNGQIVMIDTSPLTGVEVVTMRLFAGATRHDVNSFSLYACFSFMDLGGTGVVTARAVSASIRVKAFLLGCFSSESASPSSRGNKSSAY